MENKTYKKKDVRSQRIEIEHRRGLKSRNKRKMVVLLHIALMASFCFLFLNVSNLKYFFRASRRRLSVSLIVFSSNMTILKNETQFWIWLVDARCLILLQK